MTNLQFERWRVLKRRCGVRTIGARVILSLERGPPRWRSLEALAILRQAGEGCRIEVREPIILIEGLAARFVAFVGGKAMGVRSRKAPAMIFG